MEWGGSSGSVQTRMWSNAIGATDGAYVRVVELDDETMSTHLPARTSARYEYTQDSNEFPKGLLTTSSQHNTLSMQASSRHHANVTICRNRRVRV
jgi:hypothetical protein